MVASDDEILTDWNADYGLANDSALSGPELLMLSRRQYFEQRHAKTGMSWKDFAGGACPLDREEIQRLVSKEKATQWQTR